ncbi:MAG: hypothetical protein ACLUSP_03120 [Christensenellales bacterium]
MGSYVDDRRRRHAFVPRDYRTGGGGLSSATAYGLVQGVIGLILVLFTNRIVKKSDNEGIL